MPQIFTASGDTRLRAGLIMVLFVFVGSMVFFAGFMESTYQTHVGWVRDQPVPFSHLHHVGGLGVDCRYCHVSVETGAQASLPTTHVCMTCHSQLWTGASMLAPVRASLANGRPLEWQRVARLPDYVYFNHSIHISRGVPCETCHGRVDRMPLMARAEPFTMQFCLDCHRDPGPHLRPRDQVTRMDWSDWDRHSEAHAQFGRQMMQRYGIEPAKLTDCSICHR
jgi:hypothetical protein